MNYEEKYKQALERAKVEQETFFNLGNVSAKTAIERIFPELRESEDERIRKEIIELVHFFYCSSSVYEHHVSEDDMIAWLEKQGKQKSIDKIQLGKKYKCIASPRYSTFMKGNIYKPEDKFVCSLMNFCSDCFEPIEDDEQEPTDKVEPKFKVGNWITNGEYTWKIIDIKPLDYILQSQNGDVVDDTISYVDEEFHLWTIEDAKDGDVLAAHECLVLFKEIDGLNIRCYCTYHYLNSESFYIDTLQNKTAFQPATKEQCDILFQKIKEAGYVWYAKKKELMKIEQKHDDSLNGEDYGIDGLWHAQRILEKTLGEVDGYQTDDGILEHKCAIAAVNKLYKQKSSWSEEDEKMLDSIIDCLDGLIFIDSDQLNWLKSLKPNHWKPTEEQISELGKAAILQNVRFNQSILESLYNDLKSL